jgi:hypothetical protein
MDIKAQVIQKYLAGGTSTATTSKVGTPIV